MSETKEPRAMAEIQKEYHEVCLRAGAAQYQVEVLKSDLAQHNKRLYEINLEAAKRNALDKEATPKVAEVVEDVVS